MNKAFKVIWNHATQSWTAVSEIARAKGKTKSVKTAKTALAAAIATVAIGGTAQAATSVTSTAANPVAVDGTLLALGDGSTASNSQGSGQAVAISGATAGGYQTVAIGSGAQALHQFSTAIGAGSHANGISSLAIGGGSVSSNQYATAIGKETNATGLETISFGYKNNATQNYAIAIGGNTQATAVGAVAMGKQATATGETSIAIGQTAAASAAGSIAIGTSAGILPGFGSLNGDSSVAIGQTSLAAGTRAVALGRTATANGTRSTALGAGAVTEADYGSALGNRAQVLAGATNGVAVGNSTVSSADNATALGSAAVASNAGAVALGNSSTTRAATSENEATVGPLYYSGFAGNNPASVVSVGSAGAERQLVNVAAGNISATSTDAINGSQLYATNEVLGHFYKSTVDALGGKVSPDTPNTANFTLSYNLTGTDPSNSTPDQVQYTSIGDALTALSQAVNQPLTFTANTNADTGANGTQQELGSTIAIIGSKTDKALTENADAAVDSTYSAKNIQTVVTDNQVQIQMADTPELKGLTIKNGDQDSNPVVISSDPGAAGGTISNLTTTLLDPTGLKEGAVPPTVTDANKTNAATLGDVLNAGWNLQVAGQAQDLVSAYDTVNFANGTGTTATYEVVNGVNTVKYNVNVTDTAIVTPIKPNENGSVDPVSQENATKLVNAGDVVNAINNSGWKLAAEGTDGNEVIKPSAVVTFKAGDNMAVKREGADIIYSTAKDVSFDSVKVGNTTTAPAVNLTTEAAIPANNNPVGQAPNTALNITDTTGKPTQITGVGSTLNTTTVITAPAGKDGAPATANLVDLVNATTPNAAATVGDLQNMGWIVGAPGNGYTDAVKNANQVDFVSANDALTVTGKTEGNIRTITLDLDASKLTVPTTNLTNNNGEVQDPTEGDKLVNATTVAGAINDSGFTLKTSAVSGEGEKDPASTGEEVINPGDTVEMVAGKNLQVKQEADGKITYSTKDDVSFNSVQIGDTSTAGAPVVNMTAEQAIPATNNQAGSEPTTALNITSADGKPSQITGVGSTLNTTTVITSPEGKDGAAGEVKLVDLTNAATPNAAATVGDLQNMGWIVEASGNGYVDTVKNANRVDFVSTSDALTVTGETVDGVRTISVGLDKANLTSSVLTTDLTNNNGAVQDPTEGEKLVNATTVADAINGSGWTTEATNATTGAKETVVVNPGDAVNYESGNGTIASTTVVKDPVTGKDTVVVKYDIDNGVITPNADGSVTGPAVDEKAKLAEAEKVLAAIKNDATATPAQIAEAQKAVDAAKANVATAENKVATAQNVADAINGSGFRVSVNEGENTTVVNPSEQVDFDNTDGNIAIAKTTDEVSHNITVNLAKDITVDSVTAGSMNVTSSLPTDTIVVGGPTSGDNTQPKTTDTLLNVTKAAEETPDAVVTAKDLANYGWIAATPNNGYDAAVKSQNTVNFIGDDGIAVTGKANATTGTYDIVVGLADAGKIVKEYTSDENGAQPTETGRVETAGSNPGGFVSANTVADAINGSGWTTEATNATTGAKETVVVNPGDAVNYADGKGTVANTTVVKDPATGKDTVVVSFDIDNGTITPNADGSVSGPVTPALTEALKAAEEAQKALPADATPEQVAAAEQAVKDAQDAITNAGNQVATAQNVADAINGSGFRVSVNKGENTTVVNPSEQVNFDNTDKNIVISKTTDEVNHNVTVNLAKDITVNSVNITTANPVVDADGNPVLDNAGNPVTENLSTPLTTIKGSSLDVNGETPKPADQNPTTGFGTGNALSVGGNQITHVANGAINAESTDAINGAQLYALEERISQGLVVKTTAGEDGKVGENNGPEAGVGGKTLEFEAGKNVVLTQTNTETGTKLNIAVSEDPTFNTTTIAGKDGKNGITLTATNGEGKIGINGKDGTSTTLTTVPGGNYNSAGQKIDDTVVPALSVGGNQITHVANGAISPSSTDAINGSQLYALQSNINNQIGDLDANRKAGSASAMAAAGLPQAYREGQSGIVAALGQYEGETGIAVGFTSISDNGKWLFRGSYATNSQNENAGNLGIGYYW